MKKFLKEWLTEILLASFIIASFIGVTYYFNGGLTKEIIIGELLKFISFYAVISAVIYKRVEGQPKFFSWEWLIMVVIIITSMIYRIELFYMTIPIIFLLSRWNRKGVNYIKLFSYYTLIQIILVVGGILLLDYAVMNF